ncbi:DUF6686 family protein [Mesonia sp. K7]|uniref:DUF6686 family protein n=1 Tax=Mesonia sp. K7 TaxID=2218606 RepID=UPI000DA75271|nr:DUF6686 family protein [Mesonia sp. K7]PZD79204.1 hypothetical protein DNG35_01570 [Mesonia sp. K7]
MEDIQTIYYNQFGITFQWKRGDLAQINKIQLVFRKTGLLLTKDEVAEFYHQIQLAIEHSHKCQCCPKNKQEKSFLLNTPQENLSFAMTREELSQIRDLVHGTLFQLDLDDFLGDIAVGYKE